MTHATPFQYRLAGCFGLLFLGVVGVEILVVNRPDFSSRPMLPAAVTLDLLLLVPLLFYGLLARPNRWPLNTVAAAFGVSVAVAYFVLPAAQHHYLSWTRYCVAGLEIVSVAVVIRHLRRLVRAFQLTRAVEDGYVESLTAACTQVLKRPLAALVTEVSMLYYGLLSWRATPEVRTSEQAFSSHRESGVGALLGTVALLSVAEMGAAHLLLLRWWPAAAGWALLVHVYGLLFLVAHLRAIRLRPTLLQPKQQVVVRASFLWSVRIPVALLTDAHLVTDAPAPAPDLLNMGRMLLTPPNLLLTCSEPVMATGPYGMRRTVRRVSCYLDQPTAFLAALAVGTSVPPNTPTGSGVGNNP
ncbi:hypothetical protein [Hymenobacter mucosus]|uniref:Uncharacterized protein n=1 Tax=Hymenobacter mucosus TaxID=1411120 RepID=A0A238Z261_9BACT|nr:hypothetical protein [Hymenobacter mucosus]SNR77467.1 hypothetical protein SAMN06269173_106283 [Hymenobacter mucosus]